MIDSPALRHCTTTVAYSLMTNTSYKKNSQIPSVNAFSNEFSFFLNDKIDFVRNMKYVKCSASLRQSRLRRFAFCLEITFVQVDVQDLKRNFKRIDE